MRRRTGTQFRRHHERRGCGTQRAGNGSGGVYVVDGRGGGGVYDHGCTDGARVGATSHRGVWLRTKFVASHNDIDPPRDTVKSWIAI
jgi:hypothetical protein